MYLAIYKEVKQKCKWFCFYTPVSWITRNFTINLNSPLSTDSVKQLKSVKWWAEYSVWWGKKTSKASKEENI